MEDQVQSDQRVVIEYTNYRGETSRRRILPTRVFFGTTNWHHEPQWLLVAHDYDKEDERTFAMKDITRWEPSGW